jgi:hypothetical protein
VKFYRKHICNECGEFSYFVMFIGGKGNFDTQVERPFCSKCLERAAALLKECGDAYNKGANFLHDETAGYDLDKNPVRSP